MKSKERRRRIGLAHRLKKLKYTKGSKTSRRKKY